MESLPISEKKCWVINAGFLPYGPAFNLQRRLVAARKASTVPDVLLFCEHPHVITLGRNGHREHLLASQHLLRQMNVEFHSTDRGGDITYHGPGQIVGYPILNLAAIRRDVAWYVRQLEEVMIRASRDFGIEARREAGMTGVWTERGTEAGQETVEKLAALGVHLSRWVTSHGFAYNVSTDLRYFDLIVPCGLQGKRAVSLESLLGRSVHTSEVIPRIVQHFASVFEREMEAVLLDTVEEMLQEQEDPAHAAVG
ncbi:MAG TPA: lipoyl(octanoyl) transferase LipB [Candidatus Acidoferrales bacterium]|nr:lipoyl(octanoyl) transferase LipB [Candidatus Acidoferrales bacterium]